MSTHAAITLQTGEKEYKQIYCHFDGMINGVGEKLFKFYTTYEQIKNLIELGDMSFLNSTIETSYFYNRDRKDDFKQVAPEVYNINIMPDWAYYNYLFQDGEWFVQSINNSDFSPLKEHFKSCKKD